MNPWDLTASDLLVWGIVLHLIADWPLQNDWMANHKAQRRQRGLRSGNGITTPPREYRPVNRWWDRHPAAYVHAGIHGVLLSLIFGWVAAPVAVLHLLIDTRVPVVWWSRLMRQTQPKVVRAIKYDDESELAVTDPLYDIGTEVRFWTDQVFHIACVAMVALLVTL